ncbi:MAG: hypothetical protein M1821_010020 [Bathelium mastoideum]|nr:MAG: hypothetical protein M1821_010020 [Bathelium mastoideum]
MDRLSTFRNDNQRAVLDMTLELHEIGLASVLEFPQIVVTGDQSAGKSSVLEAISGVNYPRREGMCTRCAIEVVMRQSESFSITAKIIPFTESRRPYRELQMLRNFDETIADIIAFPELIEKAMQCMGLNDRNGRRGPRAFSRDVLRVQINGPEIPILTLVDLPGLIHSTRSSQTDEDVKATRALTEEYLRNRRTIVLAIISAKNDYANQIIIDLCKKYDAASRTLGIITKPDCLLPNSQAQTDFITLSENDEVHLGHGWHWLKNLESASTAEDRLNSERNFFRDGIWSTREESTLGVESLRTKLSRLLEGHLRRELPVLRSELSQKLAETRQMLADLGDPLLTVSMRRELIHNLSWELLDVTNAAIKGDYESPFFETVDQNVDIDMPPNVVRLRAAIQCLNGKFTKHMFLHGHKYKIGRGDSVHPDTTKALDPRLTEFLNLAFGGIEDILDDDPEGTWGDIADYEYLARRLKPKCLNRPQAEKWVLKVLQRCKGRELPGNYNPELIRTLFMEQSEHWEIIAFTHVDAVAKACQNVLRLALKHCAREDISERLYKTRIRGVLNEQLKLAREELTNVLEDKNGHPMTFSHSYSLTVQRQRYRRYGGILKHMARANTSFINLEGPNGSSIDPQIWSRHYVDPEKLRDAAREAADMDRFSASEALDSQIAFYKEQLKYFIDVVIRQVIERRLVKPLTSIIKTSLSAEKLSDSEVSDITAEPVEVSTKRADLEKLIDMLQKGDETFEQAEVSLS